MVVLGGIIGAIVGFVVAIVVTQVIIGGIHWHQIDDVVVFVVAALGYLVGSTVVRRRAAKSTQAPSSGM